MYLNQKELDSILSSEDLTQNPYHAIGIVVEKIKEALQSKYAIIPEVEYGSPTVSLEDNYYQLGYDKSDITLSSRYTRYVSENLILRTQVSSTIPALLRNYTKIKDTVYMCPGKVYRRDVRDKTHVGEPHQLDIWYLTKEKKNRHDLLELVKLIISVIEKQKKQKIVWRYNETSHNYTDNGIEVEIYYKGRWLEILECGLISQELLDRHHLSEYGGLALGMGLDRLVMVMKEIEDIRVLLSHDERIKKQLANLDKYKEVSNQPSIKRDMSIAVDADTSIEDITEKIVSLPIKDKIESISLVNETLYELLPNIAIERLGLLAYQKNMLIRVVIRDIAQTLSSEEANRIYEKIYELIHQGLKGYKITDKKAE
jgi:phenylalanyl-tRNA synthetase alpha chain